MDQVDDATIAEIEREMSGDGVWIEPGLASTLGISAADEERIEEAVATTEKADLKVVLIEIDYDDERFQGSFSSLSAWVHDSLGGGDATYIGLDDLDAGIQVEAYGNQPDSYPVDSLAAYEHPGEITAQVLRAAELLDDGNARALWEEVPLDERYPGSDVGVQGSEVLGGLGIVVGIGAAAAAFVVWRRRRRLRPSGFTLPSTVLHTVRSAEDRRLRQQAEAEVLALGEAIGSGEPSGTAHALAAWQQALDHYAAARSVLSQEPAPADVVGALVLARRGDDARRRAEQRKPSAWEPPVRCWFNPLHDGPTTRVTWRDDEREVEVPACRDCADSVREGQEPPDVLDFIEGDRTTHYYRLDLGAWSSTGYGSLERDLLGALRTSRSRGRRLGRSATTVD